jgi:DNA-binding response OmpR family regulator
MPRVLLIDDDVELSLMLAEYLAQDGFDAQTACEGETGAQRAVDDRFDIVVLDVMMPGLSGLDTLKRIRARSNVPILMLTARGDDIDRIVGLELGADDYVPKPCTPRELAARLRAILRRAQPSDLALRDGPVTAGPLELWPGARRANWHGKPLTLTSTEFSLLEALSRQAGRLVARDELSEAALGRPLQRFDRSIDVHVSSLRQKLGPRPDGDSWIETVRGRGYQFARDPE